MHLVVARDLRRCRLRTVRWFTSRPAFAIVIIVILNHPQKRRQCLLPSICTTTIIPADSEFVKLCWAQPACQSISHAVEYYQKHILRWVEQGCPIIVATCSFNDQPPPFRWTWDDKHFPSCFNILSLVWYLVAAVEWSRRVEERKGCEFQPPGRSAPEHLPQFITCINFPAISQGWKSMWSKSLVKVSSSQWIF